MNSDKYFNIVTVYQLILTWISISVSFGAMNANECRQFGFDSSTLQCSSCTELKQFKIEKLVKACKQCCQQSGSSNDLSVDGEEIEAKKKYASATLEVCSCNLGRFPQVQAFIQSERPSKYPNLKVSYVRGKVPTLVLYDELGVEVENLGIDKWTTDTVEEYLNEILIKK